MAGLSALAAAGNIIALDSGKELKPYFEREQGGPLVREWCLPCACEVWHRPEHLACLQASLGVSSHQCVEAPAWAAMRA